MSKSNPPSAANRNVTLVLEGEAAARRIRELALDVTGLVDVVKRGEYARAEATDNDPKMAAGWDAFRYRVRALRDFYVPQGWQRDRDHGVEMIKSACGRRAIITRAGDEDVGVREGFPQPKSEIGETIERAANMNATLALDPNWFNVPQSESSDFQTWMLLVYRRGDIVRAELSLPSGIQGDDNVLGWVERLILPTIDFNDPSSGLADEPDGDAEPVVIRRR